MNKSKGNMYPDVSHTWNPIRGKCPHQCIYCYMRKFKVGELRLDKEALNEDLGKDNIIFVGSSTDMFANEVPKEWIEQVLKHCKKFDNSYLFQSKNPDRFREFAIYFPSHIILGTTIETNRDTSSTSKAPNVWLRSQALSIHNCKKMVSIEPIMDFDLPDFVQCIWMIKPNYVSIGADSKNSDLKEPSKENIEALIIQLKEFTEVKLKDNLKRLLSIPPNPKGLGILEEFL